MLFAGVVQWDHSELLAGTTLTEQHFIVIPEPHELFDISFGLLMYGIILFGPMADLQNGHATMIKVQELCLSLFQDFQGQGCRTWIKIVYAICFHGITSYKH